MPSDTLTPAELAEGLAKGEAAGWRTGTPVNPKSQEAWDRAYRWQDWIHEHGETALRELAALQEQLTAEREQRAADLRDLIDLCVRKGFITKEEADQLAAIDQEEK
jgi:hypothetical protein